MSESLEDDAASELTERGENKEGVKSAQRNWWRPVAVGTEKKGKEKKEQGSSVTKEGEKKNVSL